MANGFIAFPNRVDDAAVVLTGGSWQIGLDALKDPALQRVARTASADPADTILAVDLGRERTIRILCLCNHTMDLDGRVRVRGWNDAGTTSLAYDSGWTDAFPAIFDTSDLEWEDDNFWSGQIDPEQIEDYPSNYIHVLPQQEFLRYWSVELENPTNPAGYIDVGRLFMAPGWVPRWNFTLGPTLGVETDTLTDTTLAGVEEHERREPRRVAALRWDFMDLVEGTNQALRLDVWAGIDRQVFLCWDPANPLLMQQRSFLGKLRTLSPLEQPYVNMTGKSVEIKEVSWRTYERI